MHDGKKSCMSERAIQRPRQTKGFYVTKCEKFIGLVLKCTLRPTFNHIPLLEFWYNIKEEYP